MYGLQAWTFSYSSLDRDLEWWLALAFYACTKRTIDVHPCDDVIIAEGNLPPGGAVVATDEARAAFSIHS